MARTPRSGMILAWALSGLLLVALAAVLVSAVAIRRQQSRDDERSAVLQAGRQTAIDFTTYQYGSWDGDVDRVLSDSTGQFKEEFSAAANQVKTQVVANQATSRGEVLEAAVASMDGDSAQVLVVANAVVTNTAAKTGQQRHYRIKLDLVREGDRWLTADLQAVG
jgi:Mce-associated membrane protein